MLLGLFIVNWFWLASSSWVGSGSGWRVLFLVGWFWLVLLLVDWFWFWFVLLLVGSGSGWF
jgi:hypothetical protein